MTTECLFLTVQATFWFIMFWYSSLLQLQGAGSLVVPRIIKPLASLQLVFETQPQSQSLSLAF